MHRSPCEGQGIKKGTLRQAVCQLGETKIYYEVAGSGPPVVLIHGLSGSTRWWCKNVPGLAERHTVFLVDLVGFGRSRRQRFVLAEAAQLLLQWMDAIGLDRASLVGHSMGGYIAAEMACRHPERVARLVLAAPALHMGRPYLQHAIHLALELRYMSPDFIWVMFVDALTAGPRTILRATEEILAADPLDRLPEITAPTLILWGEKDGIVPVALGYQLQACLPQAQFEIIPKIGHNLMWENPNRFNELVVEFLI